MAQKRIPDLQLRDEVEDALNFPSDDGIQSYRVTALQIYNYIFATLTAITRAKLAVGAIAKLSVRTETSTYTADAATDDVILCNASGGAFTVNLPAASGNTGRVFIIKKIDSSALAVTIDGSSTQTIDGEETVALYNQWESLRIMCDGSNWLVI